MGVSQKSINQLGVAMLAPHPQARTPADNRYVDLRVWLVPPEQAADAVAER
jgi:hypothetical protein